MVDFALFQAKQPRSRQISVKKWTSLSGYQLYARRIMPGSTV
jgi:hypothetical protein